MSDNNYCDYYEGGFCIAPDGKKMTCSIGINNIYEPYAKKNAVQMCSRKYKFDSLKKLETKV